VRAARLEESQRGLASAARALAIVSGPMTPSVCAPTAFCRASIASDWPELKAMSKTISASGVGRSSQPQGFQNHSMAIARSSGSSMSDTDRFGRPLRMR
jgi:hypothetical protein